MKKLILISLALVCTFQLQAQSFLPPLEEMPMSQNAYLSLKSGQQIQGKIIFTTSGRGVNKVALRDEAGNKLEHKAAEIYEFGIVSNGLVKMQYFNESAASFKALLKTDRSAIKQNDYVVFRNAKLKGGKELLLQLLNPHFDERIQVYHSVNSRKTTSINRGPIAITGEMQRAYLVSKDGMPTVKVKKGGYKKSFKSLFADCPDMMTIRKANFKDFGKHIHYYTENCRNTDPEYFIED